MTAPFFVYATLLQLRWELIEEAITVSTPAGGKIAGHPHPEAF
jgi:hypothetical protein